ncbi:MAG: GlcNAc transferase, partial [Mesorhizobium sp.]
MNATSVERRTAMRGFALTAALLSGLALAGCQTAPTGEFTNIDKAQGSAENISSLSAVIQRSPQDPEGYNVRGSAYGRGGQYQAALKDFDTAIQL